MIIFKMNIKYEEKTLFLEILSEWGYISTVFLDGFTEYDDVE